MRQKFALSLSPSDGSYTYLFSVGIVPPANIYQPFMASQALGDGGIRGLGRPYFEWNWAYVSEAERTFFRTYCPSPALYADNIYAKTIGKEGVWITARTQMFWPVRELWDSGYVMNFSLMFKVLETAVIN